MEAHEVSMKTLFKKILPSKKASENPVLRRKNSKITTNTWNSFIPCRNQQQNHHYFCKGNTNILKSTGLVFVKHLWQLIRAQLMIN